MNKYFIGILIFSFVLTLISCEESVIDPAEKIVSIASERPDHAGKPEIPQGLIPEGMVLWNKLEGVDEYGMVPSVVGPDGTVMGLVNFYNDGKFGFGATPNQGFSNAAVSFDPNLLNPEAGTIELWTKIIDSPKPYSYGVYGFANITYSPKKFPVHFYYHNPDVLVARIIFGGTRAVTYTLGFEPVPGQTVHLALVWDRSGIEDSDETIHIYVDGEKVAMSKLTWWGEDSSGNLLIGTAWDNNYVDDHFVVDNIKIFDHARTSFSMDEMTVDLPKVPPGLQ